METPKILILGAGYGGLVTAIRLQKLVTCNEAGITLVNKHDYHSLTTWLHEPAAGTARSNRAKVKIRDILHTNQINFLKGTVEAIQPEEKKVNLKDGTVLDYDWLVIGLGSQPETFGIKGLKEHAFNIRSINSVRMICEHIEYMFSKYNNEPERTDDLTFVVGGAGFTGIEFVGELADRIPELCAQFDVNPELVKIISIEASPNALPGFDPELVAYAMKVLERKGVNFRLNSPLKECTPEGVILTNGEEIKAQTVIWTGGVRGHSLVERLELEGVRGRVKVDEFLRSPKDENIFIIGDCSLIMNEQTGRPFPPTAQIATQQAFNCANNLVALLRNHSLTPFKPDLKGTLASLGHGEAIGIVGNRKMVGSTAAFMKKMSDLRYLFLLGGLSLVLKKMKR